MTFWGVNHTMVHKYDTQRAVGLLRHYQANLTNPEEQALKTSVGKVSSILGSQLFHALLDIQECYEVTLQLNTEQTVVKEDSRQDAWEWHMAAQWPQALAFQLSPELVQWVEARELRRRREQEGGKEREINGGGCREEDIVGEAERERARRLRGEGRCSAELERTPRAQPFLGLPWKPHSSPACIPTD
ncbi:hypothetical protein JOQ06_023318, partial [Pogonophryne albipinna]